LDFVRAFFNTPVWLQAGYWHLAIAAQIPAEQKSGCLPLFAVCLGFNATANTSLHQIEK
jgi:hypothetical protein